MGAMVMGQNILTTAHRQLLAEISRDRYITDTFYFTGGTALAVYYLTHRYSEDLDFFCECPYDDLTLRSHMKNILHRLKAKDTEITTLNQQLTYFVSLGKQRIKIDFAYYPFEHMSTFLKKDGFRIASLLDIAVNKVHAITSRKRGRDYFDLYFIVKKLHISVQELLQQYRLKFDVILSPIELAKHYAGVLDAVDQPKFLGIIPWKKIETYFLSEAKNLQII